ncbi:MAG: carbohydrate kinase family protein [Actinobacteria bacterium]|jgi:sugar/nucleoside kinase (ribokinase family)|nr:carbohydrate kinase family protein [Actinomycetota bacterium]
MGLILCIGDVMLDVVIRINTEVNYGSDTPAKISTHGGGAAANVASWLAFSSHKVQLVSRVGDDPAGTAVMAELDKLGVQHGNIVIQGAQTGVVAVLVDKTGERTMFPESGANSGLNLSDLPALDNVSAVYLSGYSLLNPASTTGVVAMVNAITSAKIPIIFDPASVGTMNHVGLASVKNILPRMDIVILNEEEAFYLTGRSDIQLALKELNELVPIVVIKRGSQGAIAIKRDLDSLEVSAKSANVIDTTGAGDAFAAGFIGSWIEKPDLLAAMGSAIDLATQCVAIIGARPPVNP